MVGDREPDVGAGKRAGLGAVPLGTQSKLLVSAVLTRLKQAE